ncbi:MAG: glycosyltransferase [Bacteroidia bacterium]|nr:glycosyltransferase [Bacteroidia bacterium]
MKKLSVVIVNYNVKYFLEQCLHSVFKAAQLLPVTVYVVDNNSVDGSVEMVEQKFSDTILIANKINVGFSKANNQAMRLITTPYVLLLNPDTLVEEDTFLKCIQFMDNHDDAGGLGVYMIDGKGNFLPESKRGLPTPWVAFYKIFGLSALFPKSKTFGRYHLGYLDKNQTHVVDVLSGAFMLMRTATLDKVGLLDEDFFMYGEDIDLSYRITKGGYNNYYFPETKIIHYKGESTKKSSVNYVFVFYKAMVIFAQKHFSHQHAKVVSMLIHAAVYLRAGMAILTRISKQIFAPLMDALLIYGGFVLIKIYWENNYKVFHYPPIYDYIFIPGYVCVWLSGIYLSGGYDKPLRLQKIMRGLLSATVFILVVYALLPENLRFSRALILLGTAWAALATSGIRATLHTLGINIYGFERNEKKRIVIVGKIQEGLRVLTLLKQVETNLSFIGFISDEKNDTQILGNEQQLHEILNVYKIDEVIYCAKDVKANDIIQSMLQHTQANIEFKIAPEESAFVIGSNSINDNGSLYLVAINAIQTPTNKRNKRLLDIALCLLLICTLPLLIFTIKNISQFIKNLFHVFTGSYTWVSFASSSNEKTNYKPGILNPTDALKNYHADAATIVRLNMLYAREYNVYDDLQIVLKNIPALGRKA